MLTSLRFWSALFGIVFIAIGILGFIPQATPDNLLLGLFEIDTLHNIVHIVSGVVALLAAIRFDFARLYFQIFGIIYLVVALFGFIWSGDLYVMHVNMADNILHLVIAVVALYLGFVMSTKMDRNY